MTTTTKTKTELVDIGRLDDSSLRKLLERWPYDVGRLQLANHQKVMMYGVGDPDDWVYGEADPDCGEVFIPCPEGLPAEILEETRALRLTTRHRDLISVQVGILVWAEVPVAEF